MEKDGKRLNILLVEDAAARTKLIGEALHRSQNRCRLHAVGAGPNALSYLRTDGPYADAPSPALILFDTADGDNRRLTILEKVQAIALRRDIPLALLTSPESEKLIEKKYSGNRHCVMFSPIDLDSFLQSLYARQPTRFLNAVSLIQKLGFVLVRMPREFTDSGSPENQSIEVA